MNQKSIIQCKLCFTGATLVKKTPVCLLEYYCPYFKVIPVSQ